MKPKFSILENVAIADIAFEAYGKSYGELFQNAAFAVFQMAANLDKVEEKEKRKVELEAGTVDNLLYDFLSEILFLKDSEQLLFKSSKAKVVESKGKFLVKAAFFGEKIDREKHELDNDIKAITMHMFKIEKIKNGYKATVVVDI